MWWALTIVGVFVVLVWFVRGLLNTQSKQFQNEMRDFYDSVNENRRVDDLLSDYERVQHIEDKFND